jgi:hypothetical protein
MTQLLLLPHIEPPLVYIKNGEFTGTNVAVAKSLAAAIGKKPLLFIAHLLAV